MKKIKCNVDFNVSRLKAIQDDLFMALIIILVALGSFGLGRLSKIEGSKVPVKFENATESQSLDIQNKTKENQQSASAIGSLKSGGELVGSKNGTKYYYSWCAGVKKISPANLIHFSSKAEAEVRGYTASATCKGL